MLPETSTKYEVGDLERVLDVAERQFSVDFKIL
jgi:hypothetical protein